MVLSDGNDHGKRPLVILPAYCLFQVEVLIQDHTQHMFTKKRMAPLAVPARADTGNKQLASSKKSLMVPPAACGPAMLESKHLFSSYMQWYLEGFDLFSIVGIALVGPRHQENSNTCVKMARSSWQQKPHLCD